jgi:uncharacterized protein
MQPFHLAIPVNDLEAARKFYGGLLRCEVGREDQKWIDFNFFGHQLSLHFKPEETKPSNANEVDGKQVPVRHFGIILAWDKWHELADHLKAHNTQFIIEPTIRFKGKTGEQATMFFMDPCGNALEFKSFQDMAQIFAR